MATKSKSATGPFEGVMNGVRVMPEAGALFESYWRAQAAAAEHVQQYLDEWCERRREAAEEAAECCAHVFGAGTDVAAATQALTDWTAGEVQRLREDASEQMKLASSLAGRAMSTFAENAGAREAQKGGKKHAGRSSAASEAESEDVR